MCWQKYVGCKYVIAPWTSSWFKIQKWNSFDMYINILYIRAITFFFEIVGSFSRVWVVCFSFIREYSFVRQWNWLFVIREQIGDKQLFVKIENFWEFGCMIKCLSGNIITKSRFRLSDETIDDLCFEKTFFWRNICICEINIY